MRHRFRRATAPLALVAVAAVCAGCGGSGGNTVTVWMYPVIADQKASAAYWNQIEKDFAAANKGLKANIELLPWDNRDEKLATAFAGNKGPDVVLLQPDQVPQYVRNGTVQPVDDAVGAIKSKFLPSAVRALSVNGKLYSAPIYQTVTTTIYNRKLLDKAGITKPPQTWDEIKAAAPKLRKAGVATLDYSASPEATLNLNFYPLLWEAGGRIFTPDGKKTAFNSPAGLRALTFLTDLYSQGAIPKSALGAKNVVADGALGKEQAAIGFTDNLSDAQDAAKAWGKDNLIVGLPLQGARRVGFGLPSGLGINAASKNVGAAEKFVRFMVQPRQLKSLDTAAGFFSPRTDVDVTLKDPNAGKFREALKYCNPGEPNVAARQVNSLLGTDIQAALTGKKTPQQALADAAKQADAQLARQR